MARDRNLGVTEARVGLTIITCLLLTLGYVVLQRLGGTGLRPPVEVRSGQSGEQLDTVARPAPPEVDQPYVLTPEGWESTDPPDRTLQRSAWLTPHQELSSSPVGTPVPSVEPPQQSDSFRQSRAPDFTPVR